MKRITFDTNVIGAAFKDGSNVRNQMSSGNYLAYVAETSITLDGLCKNGKIDMLAIKPVRHSFKQSRWDLFVSHGITFLLCPRIGLPRPKGRSHQGKEFEYALFHRAKEHTYPEASRLQRYFEMLRYIENELGAGQQWLKNLEQEILKLGGSYNKQKIWFENLASNVDKLEEKTIRKRFGDWADADALAAHYAYGNDIFCTNDSASGAGANSVMSKSNRTKLSKEFGVLFSKLELL